MENYDCPENHFHWDVTFLDGKQYKTLYSYDDANRIATKTYPSGLVVSKVYSNSGYEKEIYDVEDNRLLWRSGKTNANGDIEEYHVGNGLKTKMLYNPKTSLVEKIYTFNNDAEFQNLNYVYDDFGNMLSRGKTTSVDVYEEFEYDDYDRLIGIRLNGKETGRMVYDVLGNITEKEENGIMVLYGTQYERTRPNAISKTKTNDKQLLAKSNRRFSYSSFDDLVSVADDSDKLTIDYGHNHSRIRMVTSVDGRMKTKIYAGDCEIVESDGKTAMLTYIEGPCGVFAVCVVGENGDKSYNYVHRDNLGSWNVITDENAQLLQELSFDVFSYID